MAESKAYQARAPDRERTANVTEKMNAKPKRSQINLRKGEPKSQ